MSADASMSTEQLAVDTIRTLSMDAIQRANSGHPGLPLGMAAAAYVLFAKVMKHNPQDPSWPDRDRFVLSAGHGSMLLYSALHLAGYELSLDDIENFRQWQSITPGHPERNIAHPTPGVEVTTGPLGQGFANGVGMAIAERFLRGKFGAEIVDHHTYAIVSDGDLMEGISSEAASIAGQLGLGRLVYLYDDNEISLDGPTSLSFSREDVTSRFEAYGWHVIDIDDANDIARLTSAVEEGKRTDDRPTLIRVRSVIGYPSPNKAGSQKAHGAPLGAEEIRATKQIIGWDPDRDFFVPDGVYERFAPERGADAQRQWQLRLEQWRVDASVELVDEWDRAWERGGRSARPAAGLAAALHAIDWQSEQIATRAAGQRVMAAMAPFTPTMIGGAADLSESTKTEFPGGDEQRFSVGNAAGRNVFWGVREHGMGGAVNGLAAHGGIVRPYGSTFLQFSDYMRGSIRLGALSELPTAWVFTHDSVALGEDGPTHQPVEHLLALRAIPNLVVLRPADANETAECWRLILEQIEGPAALALSRQNLPILPNPDWAGIARGAYVLREPDGGEAEAVIVGTGAEVHTAIKAAALLAADGIHVRVVSMPSWEIFDAQDESYRTAVLPPSLPSLSVEAGVTLGWERYVDRAVGIDRFGASAPGALVLEKLGISAENVAIEVKEML